MDVRVESKHGIGVIFIKIRYSLKLQLLEISDLAFSGCDELSHFTKEN